MSFSLSLSHKYKRTLRGCSRSAKAKNRRRYQIRFVLFTLTDGTEICVTAAGLRAGNTRYTFVMAGVGPAVVRSGSSWHLVRYGDEYYFSTFVGRARTNLTGRWRALFARYF